MSGLPVYPVTREDHDAGTLDFRRRALSGHTLVSTPPTLGESDLSFRLLVESVADYAIFMLDSDGVIVSWNRGAERIKGYPADEIVGRHFSVFYTDEDRQRRFPEHELETATRTGRYEDEGWRVRKDGSRFWANVVITPLRDDQGRLLGFAKVTRDLTERVRATAERAALARERQARIEAEELAGEVAAQAAHLEEQAIEMESLNDELQDLNAQLSARTEEAERARAEAEAASRAKSEFLANMSHELRTPINAILGYADLLEMGISGPVTDTQMSQVQRIRLSGRHLLGLIEDILDLSRIEAGRIEIRSAPAQVASIVDEALALVAPQADQGEIALVVRCESLAGLRFVVDEERVRQIVVNLLSNAVKFTEAGGTVVVTCDRIEGRGPGERLHDAGPWLRIEVADTGIGIPDDRLEAVFEPFVQVETGHTRTRGGSGLGLAISRRLTRLMGGDVLVESEVAQGSRFALWLPLERDRVQGDDARSEELSRI